jgi:GNAT superfamily N-acetyltransferase
MSDLSIRPVSSGREKRLFLTFPYRIFKDDPLWVPPLLPDLAERLDPRRGVLLRQGEAQCFIAWRGNQPVGTICAALDRQANTERGANECIFGFFHFIEDFEVMRSLLDQAKAWAKARGLDSLAGPFNLDYEDGYGFLLQGRDRPPALLCGHTPPYYAEYADRYGLQALRGDNIAFALDLTTSSPRLDALAGMAVRVREKGRFTIRAADMQHWEEELERITVLLNLALAHLPDFRPWPREVVFNSLAPFRKIADPELILFAEENGQPIGWLPGLPNLNEALIHANGLRYPWDMLSLLWHARKQPRCLSVKSVLVRPEYWGSGVIVLLFDEMLRKARAKGYRWIDASLTSEDNPRTPALADRFGARLYKRYRVYQARV